nr:hypothetical protein [Tanacetum cinerariifolium]
SNHGLDESCSTIHPSGTPPLLPIPLHALSTSRRVEISKADMSLQNWLLLTASTPRFEVKESSAAASRQLGSTDDRAAVRAEIEEKEACLRESERERERESSETCQDLARSEAHNRALEAHIIVLETQTYRHEWQRQDADDHKMPSKKRTVTTTNTTTPMTDAQLKALIAQVVANALAERDTDRSRNGDDSHDSGTGVRRQAPIARECTYSDFLKCQPLNFKGTEGFVGLT